MLTTMVIAQRYVQTERSLGHFPLLTIFCIAMRCQESELNYNSILLLSSKVEINVFTFDVVFCNSKIILYSCSIEFMKL